MERFVNSQEIVEILTLNVFNQELNDFLVLGIVLIVIGLFLSIFSIVLMKKSRINSDIILDNVIREEVAKSSAHVDISDKDIDENNDSIDSENTKDNLQVTIDDVSSFDMEYSEHVVKSDGEIDNIVIESNLVNSEETPDIIPVPMEEDLNQDNSFDKKQDVPEIEIVEIEEAEDDIEDDREISDNNMDIIIEEVIEEKNEDSPVKVEVDDSEYVEMDEEDLEEIVVNKDIEVQIPESVEVKIVSPEKGKDIEVNLDDSLEEEIEFL